MYVYKRLYTSSTYVNKNLNIMENQQRRVVLEALETVLELQLRAVRQALGKEDVVDSPVRQRGRRRKSLVDYCLKILAEKQHPMHVDELVEVLRKQYGRVTDRDSLSSALAKKAKQGILVRRVSPATFEIQK